MRQGSCSTGVSMDKHGAELCGEFGLHLLLLLSAMGCVQQQQQQRRHFTRQCQQWHNLRVRCLCCMACAALCSGVLRSEALIIDHRQLEACGRVSVVNVSACDTREQSQQGALSIYSQLKCAA
jgi:hypothetical protein